MADVLLDETFSTISYFFKICSSRSGLDNTQRDASDQEQSVWSLCYAA